MTKEEFEKMRKLMDEERVCSDAINRLEAYRAKGMSGGTPTLILYDIQAAMASNFLLKEEIFALVQKDYQARLQKARDEMDAL